MSGGDGATGGPATFTRSIPRLYSVTRLPPVPSPRNQFTKAGLLASLAVVALVFTIFLTDRSNDLGEAIFGGVVLAPVTLGVCWWWMKRGELSPAVADEIARRVRRVNRLADAPGAATRFPHRVIQRSYPNVSSPAQVIAALAPVLPTIPSGIVVIIDGPHARSGFLPPPIERGFEPIDVHSDDLREFVRWHLPDAELDTGAAPGSAWATIARLLPRTDSAAPTLGPALIGGLTLAAALGIMSYAITHGQSVAATVAMALFLGLVAWRALRPKVRGLRDWLIPGGVIVSDSIMWRSDVTFQRYARDETPLAVDWDRRIAFVVRDGAVKIIPGGWAVLAAWLNTARTPTAPEIAAVLGAPAAQPNVGPSSPH